MNSRWKKYLLYASVIIIGVSLLFILIETVKAKNTGFETKTLWDWMELLIIPLFLGFGAFFLNRSERNNEREIATDHQREAALQSYIDRMADLLLKEKLRTTKNIEVRNLARTRTLSVLRGLDGTRKGLLLRFLYEANLIDKMKLIVKLRDADLTGADLRRAFLEGADLDNTNLTGADLTRANLTHADINDANLSNANLNGADLTRANLDNTNLTGADLRRADLSSACLEAANLRDADLRGASLLNADLSATELYGTDLRDADLYGAILYVADLLGAKVSNEQLKGVLSLKEATMPDGTKHD